MQTLTSGEQNQAPTIESQEDFQKTNGKYYSEKENELILSKTDNEFLSIILGRSAKAIIKQRERLLSKEDRSSLEQKILQIIKAHPKHRTKFSESDDKLILSTPSNMKAAILLGRTILSIVSRRRILKEKGEVSVNTTNLRLKRIIKELKKEKFDFNAFFNSKFVRKEVELNPRQLVTIQPTEKKYDFRSLKDISEKDISENKISNQLLTQNTGISGGFVAFLNGKKITIPEGVICNIEGKIIFE